MAKRYDFILSMGSSCFCSQVLRDLGLQLASFPFDWIGDATLLTRTGMALDGISGWPRKDDLVRVPHKDMHLHLAYRDRPTQTLFTHDFERSKSFEEALPIVADRFCRRSCRLRERLQASRTVLLAWIGDPRDEFQTSDAEIEECLAAFSKRYPECQFEMLAFDVATESASSPRLTEGLGFRHYWFDYRNPNLSPTSWEVVDRQLFVPYFKDFRVREYRTRMEMRSYRERRRLEKYARFGATTLGGYWLGKIRRWFSRRKGGNK